MSYLQSPPLILYASQTSNSLTAASSLHTLLTPTTPPPSTLDDFFLSSTVCPRRVVIVTSSYGVGQAPLGGRVLRSALDALVASGGRPFEGVRFSLLGLGSRHYTTWFRNPKHLTESLIKLGAELVETPAFDEPAGGADPGLEGVGVADAMKDQDENIDKWIR